MARATVGITPRDGGTGISGPSSPRRWAAIGVGGTAAQQGKIQVVRSLADAEALGPSPLSQRLVTAFQVCRSVCYAVPVAGSATDSITDPTASNPLGGTSTVGMAGTPKYDAYVRVECTVGGALAAAKVDVYVDDRLVLKGHSGATATAIGDTGASITLGGAGFVKGNAATWGLVVGAPTNTEYNGAIDTLVSGGELPDPPDWRWVMIVGDFAHANYNALNLKLRGLEASHGRYVWAAVETPRPATPATSATDYKTALDAAKPSADYERLMICAGRSQMSVPNGAKNRQVCASVVSGLAALYGAAQPIDETGVARVDVAEGMDPVLSGPQIDDLDDAGITTMTGYYAARGMYVTHARMAVATGANGPRSDYTYLERRRVMDAACRGVRRAQLPYANGVVASADGTDAVMYLAAEGALKEMRRLQMIVDFRLEVSHDRQNDRTTTTIQVVPLGKRVTLTGTVTFSQPFVDAPEEAA